MPIPHDLAFSHFLSPRHWPTWLGLGFSRAIATLPYDWQLSLGAVIGTRLGQWVSSRRHTVEINLKLCFPELSQVERDQLANRHFASLGMGMIEMAMSWWLKDEELSPLVHIEGEVHFWEALSKGKGVIFLTGHSTTLEISGHLLAIRLPFEAMYRPLRNPLANAAMLRARLKRSPKLIALNDIRGMVRSLKAGSAIWYATDQDQGGGHSVFVPFFGQLAATLSTTSRLAKATGAAVVPYWPTRTPEGQYHLQIFPALEDFPTEATQDTARLNLLLEDWIRCAPEQYLWAHRRFKTRPPGFPDLYSVQEVK
ncbi:Lipid A biosynthesis lauroyltransferase [Gammaproteobacteria bacterium]